jgi:hypothetical protein
MERLASKVGFVMQRFFKSSPAVYAEVLATLDAAWGFPKQGFSHCFLPLEYAPQFGGFAFLAIQSADADMEPAATLLPTLLQSGAVQEVAAAEYRAAMPEI